MLRDPWTVAAALVPRRIFDPHQLQHIAAVMQTRLRKVEIPEV